MAVQVEVGRTKGIEELKKIREEDLVRDQVKKRQTLCKDLGLDYQASYVGSSVKEVEKFYRKIPVGELRFWDKYLPTAYRKNNGDWANYRFDVMPKEVLEEINFADSLNIFDDIEIWSPERTPKDPIALGVVGRPGNNTFFFISRWAEALKPFEKIKEEVLENCIRRNITCFRVFETAIPKKVNEFIRSLFEENLYRHVGIYGKRFPLHCGRRVYKIDYYQSRGEEDRYIKICSKCGEIVSEREI